MTTQTRHHKRFKPRFFTVAALLFSTPFGFLMATAGVVSGGEESLPDSVWLLTALAPPFALRGIGLRPKSHPTQILQPHITKN